MDLTMSSGLTLDTFPTEMRQKIVKKAILETKLRCDGIGYMNFEAATMIAQVSELVFDDVVVLAKIELQRARNLGEITDNWGCFEKANPVDLPCKYHCDYEPDLEYHLVLEKFIKHLEWHKENKRAHVFEQKLRECQDQNAALHTENAGLRETITDQTELVLYGNKFEELQAQALVGGLMKNITLQIVCMAMNLPDVAPIPRVRDIPESVEMRLQQKYPAAMAYLKRLSGQFALIGREIGKQFVTVSQSAMACLKRVFAGFGIGKGVILMCIVAVAAMALFAMLKCD